MDIISDSLCKYSFFELMEFSPLEFKDSDTVVCLEVGHDYYQSYINVPQVIDLAREEFLTTALYNLAMDSLDGAYIGLLSRMIIYFRDPTKYEIEEDKQLIIDKSKDILLFKKDISDIPRVQKIDIITRVFDGLVLKDISNLINSIDSECKEDLTIVPQPYEIFFSHDGHIGWQMFNKKEDYNPKSLQDFLISHLIDKDGMPYFKVEWGNIKFNPYSL